MSTATQATDLLAAWERHNASLEALIESADGEYQEQRRFSAFEAGWRDGGNASVDATLRDTLVLAAGKRIDDLERALAAATARAESERAALSIAERESCEFSPWIAKYARVCRICDQVGLKGAVDHAPDCPFVLLSEDGAALAAAATPESTSDE